MPKAQDYINQYYPHQQRAAVKELDLRNKSLEGNLDLTSFYNLEELDCSNNNITNLQLFSNELCYLDCSRNNLSNLDLTQLNARKLTYLRISNNRLSQRDLSMFSNFVNLEMLLVGNDSDKKDNNFFGSLSFLQNLSHLQELDTSNTDIDSGLDYLPASLVSIHCYNDKKNNSGVSIINEALKPYNFQINKWRQDHGHNYVSIQTQLAEKERKIQELENQVKEYQETLIQFSEQLGQKEIRHAETQTTEEIKEGESQQIAHVEVTNQ